MKVHLKHFYLISNVCSDFPEEGLEQALRATDAIYSKDVKSLVSLSSNELEQVFSGAPVVTLLLSPGITVLELGMKANCFPTESE